MKKIYIIIFYLLTITLLPSCDSNKKLEQVDAENAINEFIQINSFTVPSLGLNGRFNVNAIYSIAPISQFTETEANSIVKFNFYDAYSNGPLILKFNFKRNIDKKWVLTSVDGVSGVGSQNMSDKLMTWQNTNIMVTHPKNNKSVPGAQSVIKDQIENAVDPNQVPQKDNESQVKYTDIQEFYNAFKKAILAEDMKEISKFVSFPVQTDSYEISKSEFLKGETNIKSYFKIIKTANSLHQYNDNDFGIQGTSLKFRKHSDGFWKLDEIYGSPDFER